MKPAPSIIVFTTAAGAGFGLLLWLGLLRLTALVPAAPGFALLVLGVGLVLATGGLLSSVAHLGRPERAWRALSQWRSSWLSREGVAALVTYPLAVAFGAGLWLGWPPGLVGLLGLLMAVGAAATLWCTGMIYASLKPIRQWHHPLVAPGYVVLGGFSGMLLLALIGALGGHVGAAAAFTLHLGIIGLLLKVLYWRAIDAAPPLATAAEATGLAGVGAVRPLDPPHTETNYLLREMGYRVARKHAGALRRVAIVAGFVAPAILAVLAGFAGSGAVVLLGLAALLATVGLLVERWLMFAEATHTVTLYYGGRA